MNRTSLRLAAMLAVALSFDSRPALALDQLRSFTFSQTGYSEGATVTGAFAGIDLDGNGILVHFPEQEAAPINVNELHAFSMHFSGNSLRTGVRSGAGRLIRLGIPAWHEWNRRRSGHRSRFWRHTGRHWRDRHQLLFHVWPGT